MIIAVDFDQTISMGEYSYPYLGDPNLPLISKLKELKKQGTYLILWTCRMDEALSDAVEFCKMYGLEFDAVNDNLDFMKDSFHNNCRKIFANIYVDDRNMNVEDFSKWFNENNV